MEAVDATRGEVLERTSLLLEGARYGDLEDVEKALEKHLGREQVVNAKDDIGRTGMLT